MFTRRTIDSPAFTANDGCELRELLHPVQDSVDLPYSIAAGRVQPGARTLRHRLAQAEVYYIRDGSGIMHIGGESRPIMPGDVVFVPPGAEQWVENPGTHPLEFLVIVSPPWRAEDDQRLE